MASSRNVLRSGRRLIAALALAFTLAFGLMPASAVGQASRGGSAAVRFGRPAARRGSAGAEAGSGTAMGFELAH